MVIFIIAQDLKKNLLNNKLTEESNNKSFCEFKVKNYQITLMLLIPFNNKD